MILRLVALFFLTSLIGSAGQIDFSRDIRPIFIAHCTACHGGVKQQGDVSFLYREQVIAKGKSGKPTVVPHDPDASQLMYHITAEKEDDIMPPPDHGPRLSNKEISLIRQWIEEGAEWNNHWSFEKPTRHELPKVEKSDWPKNAIDHFVLARMEKEGLRPNKPAKPSRLLRRIHLDLTGYPPTLEELESFEKSFSSNPDQAVAQVADKLLAHEAFGEKWASQWLDLARYADSEGLGADRQWHTWPYRDWVTRALNADMPYHDFITKQIAGDLLPNPTLDDLVATNFHRLTQQNAEGGTDNEEFRIMSVMDRTNTTWDALQGITFGCVQCHDHPYDPIKHDEYYKFFAFFNSSRDLDMNTHYPVLRTPRKTEDYPKSIELQKKIESLATTLQRTGQSLISSTQWQKVSKMTIKSHRMQSEGKTVDGYLEFRPKGTIPNHTSFTLTIPKPQELSRLTALRIHTLPVDVAKAKHSGTLGAVISQITLEAHIPGAETPTVKVPLRYVMGDDTFPVQNPQDSLKESPQGWGAYTHQYNPRSCVIILESPLELPENATLTLQISHKAKAPTGPMVIKRGRIDLTDNLGFQDWFAASTPQIKELGLANAAYRKLGPTPLPVMAELPETLSRETHTFIRGNWLEKADKAHLPETPGSLHKLTKSGKKATRLDLARWLTSPENPFTARVLVARTWEQIFGLGLVETLEDFGSAGIAPTHQELLDDLAVRFQTEMKGSVKTLIREILLSATYRQSSEQDSLSTQKDQQNVYLSRGPRNRLSAEHVRDHHLHVSGLLKPILYGPPVRPPIPDGVWKPFNGGPWKAAKVGEPSRYRRALYTYRKRSIPHPSMDAFDSPTRELCSTRRLTSNTPLAALVTLNDKGFTEMSGGLARRMKYKTEGDLRTKLATGYRLATSTKPSKEQLDILEGLYTRTEKEYRASNAKIEGLAGTPDGAAFVIVASTILNLDDALTK